jgi:cytochrome c peroxidase
MSSVPVPVTPFEELIMKRVKYVFGLVAIIASISSVVYAGGKGDHDPAQVAIGERLTLETRFAQAYAAHPDKADPAMAYTLTLDQPLRGPFAGKTMNCRACHLVDEHKSDPGAGMRSYADFTHVSPIPERNDGDHFTPRNSMSLVNITPADRHDVVFHFDGEFNSMQDLVRGTLAGRNYGWLPDETAQAVRHVAQVIRDDDGQGQLAKEFGGSYRKVLAGTARDIPAELRLPKAYRVDVATASDAQIMNAVAKLISAYVNNLHYEQDAQGNYIGSPYDQFLKLNKLPRQPRKGESAPAYAQRLLHAVTQLKSPRFIRGEHRQFKYHQQAFAFTKQELAGMKLFFTRGSDKVRGGNCVSCHAAPDFSDFGFHNTGVSQVNYDQQHGPGEFAKLQIPDLAARNKNYDEYLPATTSHTKASGQFRNHVNLDKPGYTDLGLWNVFANPDMPGPQAKLMRIMCRQHAEVACNTNALLPYTVAAFKTPVLRDLGHSNPYMHTGEFNTLEDVVRFYVSTSALVKSNQLRNADKELHGINLHQEDIVSLVAFLKSLNEDYE